MSEYYDFYKLEFPEDMEFDTLSVSTDNHFMCLTKNCVVNNDEVLCGVSNMFIGFMGSAMMPVYNVTIYVGVPKFDYMYSSTDDYIQWWCEQIYGWIESDPDFNTHEYALEHLVKIDVEEFNEVLKEWKETNISINDLINMA